MSNDPIRVLFVCTANICRSPFAELITRHVATEFKAPIEVRSAGTHGMDAKEMDPVMAAELAKRGVDSSGFRSHAVTAEDIAWADIVLTMENSHRTYLLDDHPGAARRTFSLGNFAARADEITESGREAIRVVGQHRGGVHSEEDVTDPYGRGVEPTAAAAERIEALARLVLDILAPDPSWA